MHIHFLDPYRPLRSPIHGLDTRVKLVLTLAFIVTCSITPIAAWPAYFFLFALVLSAVILSGLGVPYVLKRSALALPFALAAFPVIFSTGGHTLFELPLAGLTLTATGAGMNRFLSIMLKSWLSVQAAILLATSSPFPDLLQAMRAVGAPKLLVAMFGLMWRYMFVLVDEALRLARARAARSGEAAGPGLKAGGSLAWRGRVTGGMAGSLLLRAFERSERIYSAMLARGYDGEIRSLPPKPLGAVAWASMIVGLLVLFLVLVLGIAVNG